MIYNNSCKSVLTTIRCPNKEQANAEEKQHLPFFKFSTKKSNIAYSPFFKFCLTPLFLVASKPHPTIVVMFLWLNGWSCHIWCDILLNDIVKKHIGRFWYHHTRRTLMCVLCNKASSLLQSDTELSHPYKYIFTPAVLCSQQLSLLHWMNTWMILKIYFSRFLSFQKLFS